MTVLDNLIIFAPAKADRYFGPACVVCGRLINSIDCGRCLRSTAIAPWSTLRTLSKASDLARSSKNFDRLEFLPKNCRNVRTAHPPLYERSINAPEIGCVAKIAIIQIGQARRLAVVSTLNSLADHEHGAGGSMVGAQTCVLRDAAPELAE